MDRGASPRPAPGAAPPPPADGQDASPNKPETRLVVVGDSDFAANAVAGIPGNQDMFLNMVNWLAGYDRIVTRPGEAGVVSFWYYAGDTLLAVDALNDARAYMIGKRLIEMGRSPDAAEIANPETNLKALLK